MTNLIHAPSVGIWIPQATAQEMAAGLAREKAAQAAAESYDYIVAPPCPACGQPVSDRDWEKHKYQEHDVRQVCQPYGTPDARELLLLAYDAGDMERKLAIWRSKHPGVRLEPAGDGTRENGKIIYRRWRLFDAKGKAAE